MTRACLFALVTLLPLAGQDLELTRMAGGLRSPLDIQTAGDGSNRLFFVEQRGVIRVFREGALVPLPFLDISDRTREDGERGLLGLAFPPGFEESGYFYVDYTRASDGATIVARYRVGSNPDVAIPSSEEVLLTVAQPFANHNGGQLRFGPDGYLYVGLGDGGSAGDPQGNAQNGRSLLGKLLRLDVEQAPGPYKVPADNPFVNDSSYRPEIWDLGLRNPWRFSFDRETGDLWIADVGQNRAEEINFEPASSGGRNYGWNRMEGLSCFRQGCDRTGLTLPVLEYTRENGDVSVTGGFVYRGSRSPSLRGVYLYADFATGRIWGLRRQGEEFRNSLLLDSPLIVSSFGEDEAGELYVADHSGGAIYRITASSAPVFLSSAVVNAASNQNGLVPGSAATVYGSGFSGVAGIAAAEGLPLPGSLAGASVTVNGRPAPLYAVANTGGQEQINFQTPFETEVDRAARVIVTHDGVASETVEVPVFRRQPGVYTQGANEAVVVHAATNQLVSAENPLRRGEFAYLYAAGLGAVDNPPATGEAMPVSPLARIQSQAELTIGGTPCPVPFAGLAPGLAGVYQVNLQVADGVPSGRQDLVLSVDGTAGPAVSVFVE